MKMLDFGPLITDCMADQATYRTVYPTSGCCNLSKNPVLQFIAWSFLLCHPIFAQEAIQIEIDNAPVEVEIQKPASAEPATPASQETAGEQTAEVTDVEEETAESGLSSGQTIGIAIGAVVAAGLALLAGGGGGGGGSATQH